jgi:hypothetical protein
MSLRFDLFGTARRVRRELQKIEQQTSEGFWQAPHRGCHVPSAGEHAATERMRADYALPRPRESVIRNINQYPVPP